jgi:hypothetical protein
VGYVHEEILYLEPDAAYRVIREYLNASGQPVPVADAQRLGMMLHQADVLLGGADLAPELVGTERRRHTLRLEPVPQRPRVWALRTAALLDDDADDVAVGNEWGTPPAGDHAGPGASHLDATRGDPRTSGPVQRTRDGRGPGDDDLTATGSGRGRR